MRVSALLYTLCAAGMRRGTLCCMPLQVRSAALRRIHAAHNIKVYRKACMERSAHGVQLSRSAHAHFSSLLNFETPKSPENKRTITIYVKSTAFFFFLFGKVPGWRWPAGWLAWELARLAGLAGRLAGAGSLMSQPASRPSPARKFPKKEKKKTVDFT